MKFKTISVLSALMVAAVFFVATKKSARYPADFRDAPRAISDLTDDEINTESVNIPVPSMVPADKTSDNDYTTKGGLKVTPEVQMIVTKHASKWVEMGQIPGWDNNHAGYEALFNELKAVGFVQKDLQYRYSLFGGSSDFRTDPKLIIYPYGDDYFVDFKLDPNKGMKVSGFEMWGDKTYIKKITPEVQMIIAKHASKWIEKGRIPGRENNDYLYEYLFDELKAVGFIPKNTQYRNTLFGHSYNFEAHPDVAVHDGEYSVMFLLDAKKGMKVVDVKFISQ